jgi:flagellar L-ring protein precursor FlgH
VRIFSGIVCCLHSIRRLLVPVLFSAGLLCVVAQGALAADLGSLSPKKLLKSATPEQLRQAYLARLQQQNVSVDLPRSIGSLWAPDDILSDLSSDYKAAHLNDVVVVQVSVQTTAAQSGNVNSQRQFSTTSGISGLVGGIATHGTNPLLNAQSNTALKGQGQTSSNTTFVTSLTGRVIAVLPNGNLVIEAERQIFMNNQHENLIIRGVARPGDLSSANTIPSTALASLEIELKGKGIISDSIRSPNPITRAVLWLFGF